MKDEDEIQFFFSDFTKLFWQRRKSIFCSSVLFAIVILLLLLLKGPKFEMTATFRDLGEKREKTLFSSFLDTQESSQSIGIMKSMKLLKKVIEKLGLQAQVGTRSFFQKAFSRLKDNLYAEWGMKLCDIESFEFENLFYEGEHPLYFSIRFSSKDSFDLLDEKNKVLLAGKIGQPTILPNCRFILCKAPSSLKVDHSYSLTFLPWQPIARDLMRKISILEKKQQKNILELTCFHRDRQMGCKLLNQIMEEYHLFLEEEHQQFALAQIDYLEKRRNQLLEHFNAIVQQQMHYAQNHLGEYGFFGMDQHLKFLLTPLESTFEKLSKIELQLKRLEQSDSLIIAELDHPKLHGLLSELKVLQGDKDQLDLSFSKDFLYAATLQQEQKWDLLQKIRDQKEAIEKQIIDVKEGKEEDSFFSEQDWLEHFDHCKHLLNVKEKIVKELHFTSNDFFEEECVDLETVKKLYMEYNHKLSAAQIVCRQYLDMAEQMKQEQFELSSLSAHLNDPMSQELISMATKIKWQLDDEKNFSPKEEFRLKQELALQKNMLLQHIHEMVRLTHLQIQVLQEKITSLRKIMLHQLGQKISICHQQVEEYLTSYRESLLNEKELIQQKLKQLKQQMMVLPEKWKREKELELNTKLNLQMMQSTTGLVEKKTIEHHLQHIASKPLDSAMASLSPVSPHLTLFFILALIAGGSITFAYYLVRCLLDGFSISLDALKASHPYVCGEISSFCDGPFCDPLHDEDLQTLRVMSQFLKKSSVVTLLAGKGPNYSHCLAQLLFQKEWRVLLIDASFPLKYLEGKEEGLLGFLEKKTDELFIDPQKDYDFVHSGGYSRFANEYISSSTFSKLLEDVKKKYDVVLLFTRSLSHLAEAKTYFAFSDQIIVSVKEETIHDLKPFIAWAHPQKDRLSFVMHA